MKIETYERAHALMVEKKELAILNRVFCEREQPPIARLLATTEFHSSDFYETFHGYNLTSEALEELKKLISDFCAKRFNEIDEEILKL